MTAAQSASQSALEALRTILREQGGDLEALSSRFEAQRLIQLLDERGFEIVPKTQHLAAPFHAADDRTRG